MKRMCELCLDDIGEKDSWHANNEGSFHFRCEVLAARLILHMGIATKDIPEYVQKMGRGKSLQAILAMFPYG